MRITQRKRSASVGAVAVVGLVKLLRRGDHGVYPPPIAPSARSPTPPAGGGGGGCGVIPIAVVAPTTSSVTAATARAPRTVPTAVVAPTNSSVTGETADSTAPSACVLGARGPREGEAEREVEKKEAGDAGQVDERG